MYLGYFDEVKPSDHCESLLVGGILVPTEPSLANLESEIRNLAGNFFGEPLLTKDREWHGVDIFQGKGPYRGRTIQERLGLFRDLVDLVVKYELPIQVVVVNIPQHRARYQYPDREYPLALMLLLERFCDLLDDYDERAVIFGDYEKDEMGRAITDFSNFQARGVTHYHGRSLDRLIDTLYFTQSHHSRLLQLADVVLYLVHRFDICWDSSSRWIDLQGRSIWEYLKESASIYQVMKWPK